MNCGRIGFLFGNLDRFRAFYLRIWDIHSSVVDACGKKFQNVTMAKRKSFASVSMQDDKPFDCLRTLFDCGDLWRHAASLIRAPTEVVKQRMQTGQFTSASAAVRLIAAKEGFKGLYAGYGSFLLRDLPFDAIQFCLYGQLRIGYKVAAKRELNDPENAIYNWSFFRCINWSYNHSP